MISYVLPTRNRPLRLVKTLDAIGQLPAHDRVGGAEVVVVDNASDQRPVLDAVLPNGIDVRLIERECNEGAAARNAGVLASNPASTWIVMLDDDSHPLDLGFARGLMTAPPDVGAITADIRLPGLGRREAGGLPEVPVGCGVAYRRDVYERLGGYDASFDYYVEEYDLAARLLLAGYRVAHDPWFRVAHHKIEAGRDFSRIMARLVRNNGWVIQRYTPDARRLEELRDTRRRYRRIALKEDALDGYARGLIELRRTIRTQPRTPMSQELYDRFTGLASVRCALDEASTMSRAAIVGEGKNAWVVRRAMRERGIVEVSIDDADALIIGTMSPGPMADVFERLSCEPNLPPVIAPWLGLRPDRRRGADALTGTSGGSAARRGTKIPA